MKLSVVILFISVLNASAGLYSQTKLTLKINNRSVKEVFKEIEQQSKYRFLYNEDYTDLDRTVQLNVVNSKVENVLDKLFAKAKVTYRVLDNNLIVITPAEYVLKQQQQHKISGRVIDASTGEPLVGVSVQVEKTTQGTITDPDGTFSLSIDNPNSVLIFSYMGYTSERVALAGESKLTIQLKSSVQKLDEVVVVGYGTVKRKDVTGAITSVTEDQIKEMPVKDALQAMQGKTAGVDITTNQRPGEVGSIKIRGIRSLYADQDPLYVVDGMVLQSGGIDNLNTSDIETIDILKDASATAIYGARGANGVVIVTTKHGKDGKLTLNYSGSVTLSKMYDVTKYMDAAEWLEYARLAKKLGTPTYTSDYTTWGSNAASFANIAKGWTDNNTVYDPSKVGNFDWRSLGKQTGLLTEHTLSASGGNDKFQGYGSFGYLNQDGTIKDQKFKRYTAKTTLEITPKKWFKLGTSIDASWASQDYGYNFTKSVTGSGDYYSALAGMLPWTVPYDSAGNYIRNPAAGDVNIINPINESKYNTNQRQTLRAMGSFYSQVDLGEVWKPLAGLKYRIQFGPEFKYNRVGVFNDANGINGDGSNKASYNNYLTRSWTLDNLVYYDRTIAKDHQIGITLMQSSSAWHSEQSTMTANVASSSELWYNISSLGTISTFGSGLQETQRESYLARANYSYKGKYLLTAAIRYDGASMLGPGNKWESFPSLALAWRIDQENFMKNINWLNLLKLRLGYGIVGNSAVEPYAIKGPLTSLYYNWGTTNSSLGYVASDPSQANPSKMANPKLGWERTAQYNLGLDYSFLNGRILGSIDGYKTRTNDLLLIMTVPSLTGYNSTWANVGITKDWGIDFQLTTTNIKTSKFSWSTNLTWSKDRNKIVQLNNGRSSVINSANNSLFVGQPTSVFYDYVYDGIWKTSEADSAANYGRKPGQIKVKDLNHDGKIDDNHDKTVIGHARPDWTGGMTNTFTYKNLELSFFIFSRWGGMFQNGALTLDGRYMQRKIDYWVAGTNENAKYGAPGSNGEAADTYSTSMNYQNGSFIKLRYINLGYNFSPNQLKKFGIGSLKVYAQCQNPFMIYSKCDYLDTDQLNYDNNTTTTGSATTIRSLVFGVNVAF